MKSPAAYYLILLYTFALCRPVMPLIQDVIAHTFFEHQHLAAVHKDSGKDHVDKEIGKLSKEDSADSASLKSYDHAPVHVVSSVEFHQHSFQSVLLSHYSYFTSSLSATSLAIQLPPPKG